MNHTTIETKISTPRNAPIILPMLAELLPRGDGTYVLKPKSISSDFDSWISAKNAAEAIGIEGRSIYRLLDASSPWLVHKRPLKGKCLVSLKSVYAYVQATSDPDFWDDPPQQQALRESVRKAMEALRGASVPLHR